MATRFAVLGPVEVTKDGSPLTGLAPRHRAVLAYLLLHARTVLSPERLIDAIWGPTPPGTARAQIHAAITAIRRQLREVDGEHLLATRSAGYVLTPERGQLDLDEFVERLTTSAPDRATEAAGLRAALELWRGEPLAGVHADYVTAARARLVERRLAAVERLAGLELALGRHRELIDELVDQVGAHPLREGLVTALMLALYRAGRQTDALAAARVFRTTLADEQGLDPTRTFADLEAAILRGDAGLDPPPVPAPAAPPTPDADTGPADPDPSARPSFLPYDLPDFTGRTAELDQLGTADAVRVLTVDGMAGVGKTTLAVRAAHQLAARYPDGQLFLDLHAHTAGQQPLDPGSALDALLRQLGVPAEHVPGDLAGQAALWRTELATRRVLVVLDNAADADHVRHLLPGSSPSLFLITSRRRLTDLDGARALSVDVLPAADAVELFGRIVGDRAEAEPVAALDVLQLCDFLPLAVRIAAARLHHRPQWTVGYLADRLRDQRRRLAELSTTDRGVAAAFALSYHHLAPERRRMFRLLGLHPGHDLDAEAAAALADLSVPDAETALEDLLDTHMLLQRTPGRYTWHDLLREHARAATTTEDPDDARRAALTRLILHYLRAADAAIRTPGPAGAGQRWLDTERANLIAIALHTADPALPADAAPLAATLHRHLYDRAQQHDAETRYTEALTAHQRRGDQAGEARVLIDLGWIHWLRGRYQAATDHFGQALDLATRIEDTFAEARARQGLGNVSVRQRDGARAEEHFRLALDLFRAVEDRYGEAGVLTGLGVAHTLRGQFEAAVDRHEQAITLCREIDDPGGVADATNNLGVTRRRAGDHDQARALHERALAIYDSIGFRSGETAALNDLGETTRLAGAPADARTHHSAALALAKDTDFRPEQARALDGLALAEAALGQPDRAREHAAAAARLYTDFGLPPTEDLLDLVRTGRAPSSAPARP